MGLSSANVTNKGIQFCIFDSRRGQHEGQELDKILFFYPSECPYSSQLSVIGLCEGIITFTRIFSPEAACEVIEAEKHTHVFYEAEPDIWMIMVVEKSKYTESVWRSEPLQRMLKEIHSLFVMFHGSLKTLLDKQPSGEFARTYLYFFLTDYLTDFTIGKKIQLPFFHECLKEGGTVQMLTISRDMAIEIQVSQKIVNIEEKLSRGWGGENAYHVKGYRYLLLDGDRKISRASPPAKVSTLSKDSLLALNKLREEVDLEKKRSKLDNPKHEKDFETCIRARNNAWVIAKISRGRELYMALEKASETLLFASDAVEKFSNSYCEGAFSLD